MEAASSYSARLVRYIPSFPIEMAMPRAQGEHSARDIERSLRSETEWIPRAGAIVGYDDESPVLSAWVIVDAAAPAVALAVVPTMDDAWLMPVAAMNRVFVALK